MKPVKPSYLVIVLVVLAAVGVWTLLKQQPSVRDASAREPAQSGPAMPPESVAPNATEAEAAPQSSKPVESNDDRPTEGRRIAMGKRKIQPIDVREVARNPKALEPEKVMALAALTKELPGAQVTFDSVTGAASSVQSTGHFLTTPSAPGMSPQRVVSAYIDQHQALFGHSAEALKSARVTTEDVTAHNGMVSLVWNQQVDGVPVFKTIFKANLTRKGQIITLNDHFLSDPLAATGLTPEQRQAALAQPAMPAERAIVLAAASLNDVVAEAAIRGKGDASGAEQLKRYTAPGLSDTSAQLTYMPMDAQTLRLGWDVTTMSLAQNEMFRLVIDAATGEVLYRTSLTNDATDASYRVYANPTTKVPLDSPAPMMPGTPTPSGAQGTEVPRSLITLQSVNPTASPNGWINDGGMETLGNNVDAHSDTDANNSPDLPRPNGGASRVFDFPCDLTALPSAYRNASVTHLFYLNNWMHDQLYSLGFTETSRNFQTDNFSRGGNGSDAVQADAQDGSGTNNANMSTPADGSAPRMQMYVFPNPEPDRDGDFDDIIVLHEYTHGLSNRLVGGGVGISALATGGMGEGWSDFYGMALLADPASDPNGAYPGGAFATYQLSAGFVTNYYYGIRRYPYCTDMSKNPLTLKDIDPLLASPHTGVPLCPRYTVSNGNPSEVHASGEVWCMALWECRAALMNKHGSAGHQMILQITTDAMKLCPVNPNFLQSRDAVIQADLVNNGGANNKELWAAFAKRGFGKSAIAPASSTTTGITEAYDVPDPLLITPATTFAAKGAAGGPFTPSVQTYTLTNTDSTNAFTWTAAPGVAWLSVSPSSGSLAAGATTTVTMTLNSSAAALTGGLYNGSVVFTNATSTVAQTSAVSLNVGVDYFTELFTSGNDTDNQSWLFTPNSSYAFYSVQGSTVAAFPTDPTGGTTIVGVDNGYAPLSVTGGQSVKLYGTSYTSFNVGSNGNVMLGSGDTVSAESLGAHFSRPRISALFDDLNPATQGSITWKQLADRIAVTYQNVPEFGTTNSNNFQIEMYFDGRIRITCLGIAATDGMIGLSKGVGQPADFVMSNFSDYTATPVPQLVVSLPAAATEGNGVLTGQGAVTLPSAAASNMVVTLTSSNSSEASVPASVTVLAGQTTASFDITIGDDAITDGTQTAVITATAVGYSTGGSSIAVQDNDGTAVITLTMPTTATEGSSNLQGSVSIASALTVPVTIGLANSDNTAVLVPAGVVIPAGQTSAPFAIAIVNDIKIDGTQTATITASVAGWTSDSKSISVLDNETTTLALALPATVTEGATGTCTVSLTGTLPAALVISLSSNTTSRLTVPATVTIAAGATSATFTATAPNNTLTDGSAAVAIAASASGFTGTSANTTVLDNDLHHYAISTIAASQTRGAPFSATITAQDINNVTLLTYTTAAALTANGASGTAAISPTTTTAFTAGVWTGNLTINTFDTNVVITASDGAGHTGASNAFTVGTGALHHFAWNAQSTRARGAAVSATVTAQDLGNNTVTTFSGSPALSGYVSNPAGSTIVITELNPNTPDEIEFMNVGASAVSVAGWTISLYDYTHTGSTALTYTIPAGASCAPGSLFKLTEFGTAPGTFPSLFTGANIDWVSDPAANVGVLLRDASGNMIDFVCVGALTAANITFPAVIPTAQWSGAQIAATTNTTFSYLRTGNSDTNVAANWSANTSTMGTANTGLSTPFPSSIFAVSISPTTTSAFTSGVWTGNMSVLQTASQMRFRADDGATHVGDSNAFDVTGTLALSVPTSAPESAGTVTGTVTVSSAPAGDLVVSLTSSDATAATVPATVTVPSGQTSATFAISVVDDAAIDGTQVATITAHLNSWTDATANLSVLDNETLSLSLFLPSTLNEGSTATATVSTSGAVASALTVTLSSNTTSRLTVPATVTIPSGSASVTFTVTGVENTAADGTAAVIVSASAAGYTGATANTSVLDNDVHHFTIANIASPQTKGVGFSVSITAFDVSNAILTGYSGAPGLTATGSGGSLAISPANASGFVNGVWSGQVTAFQNDTAIILTVNDGAGHTGTSNSFDVVNPLFSPTVLEPVSPVTLQPGVNPKATLVVGADGAFYGTTQFGGSSNQGTVFKITSAGVLTTLANFYGANGAQPFAGVILASDGNFYGTTSAGGSNNLGTVFKMTPSGQLTTLVNCSTATGTVPKAPLLQGLDGNFYGTTSTGGSFSSGTVFKMTSSGVVTVLVNFAGTSSIAYGSSCQAGLIQASDGNFYGTTSTGGSGGGFGTVFKVTPAGVFTSLASFTGTTGAVLGSAPLAALVQASDSALYGTASVGGTGGFGTVFKITTAGVFTNLLSFTNTTGVALGSSPQAPLVQRAADSLLYGSTSTGGTNSVGTLFKISTAGVLTTIRSLSSTDGANPFGAMVLASDAKYYGLATNGGGFSRGTVFNLDPATSTYTRLLSFVISPAVFKRLLLASDGNFYGTTSSGAAGFNSVFKLTPGGTLSAHAIFTSNNSTAPFLSQGSDGNLYGTVPSESSNGQVFSLTFGGTKTTMATLTGTTGSFLGSIPVAGITQGSDGLWYGTTQSGGSGGSFGSVFKITTGGTFTSLASFTNTSGATLGNSPQTRLVEGADGNFYGTTQFGGAGGFGTVFRITPSGTLTTLVAFTGTTGVALGSAPNTNLLLASDGNFYGTTTGGGTGGFGTIYKIAPDGSFTSLLSFTSTIVGNLGSSPSTNLIQGSDGNLYGTTTSGGVNGGNGTVFKVTPAGVLTSLVSFSGSAGVAPGSNPHGTLIQSSDGYLYGTTTNGGLYNLGTIFRVSSSGLFQSLYAIGSANDGGSPNSGGSSLYPDAYRLIAGNDGYLYGVNASSVFRVHQQPSVQSIAATGITSTDATLSGSVIANQDAGTAYFQYGVNTSYSSQTTAMNLTPGTGVVPLNATLSGLLPGVVYHFRLVTVTPQGTFFTADQTFATPGAPQVITGSMTNAGQTGFALDGVVNPLGNTTSYYFEYGSSTAYGNQTTAQSAGSGIANVAVNTAVNGLLPATTYHVRLVASNNLGTSLGDDQAITTFAPSTATVQPMSQYTSTGTNPLAGLYKASDGSLYGTTNTGGTFGSGTVFKMTQGGTLSTVANFYNNTNATVSGAFPQTSLVQTADGSLYGTTNSGGSASGFGSIFKISPTGVISYPVLFNSSGSPLGSSPICGLTLGNDGNLYGVTQSGGSSFNGTIFKLTPSGTFTTLVSFTGTTGSYLGSSPRAALLLAADGNFYGTTATGGAGGFGTVFKVTPAGVLTTLIQFTGTTGSYPGATPVGALVQGADGNLYGSTSLGGANNLGTLFKVSTTATFTSLVSFTGTTGSVLGNGPKGALVQAADGNFYGTTQTGGTGNLGTVFAITPAGVLTTLVNLTGSTGAALGTTPQGALVIGNDGALYGTTNSGGLNNVGSIFKVTTGGLFSTLVNLTTAPSIGRLVQGEPGNLTGAALNAGGANGYGSLFAAPLNGAPATLFTLVPVSGTTSLNARAGMLRGPDFNYYGTTVAGGANNSGSVFKLTPAGVYTTLISFTGNTGTNPGSSPQTALILGSDASNYYGTTSGGGSSGFGTIFAMTPAGVQTTIINFTGTSGANPGQNPSSPLLLAGDGNYYGTTSTGGASSIGTIFKMTPAGVLTSLASFTGSSGAVLGANPSGVLVQGAEGNIYGTTSSSGLNGFGSIFKITPAGVFTSVASFTGSTGTLPGQSPTGGLFAGNDGCLYGVTANGGPYGQGTAFRILLDDSVASIYSFSGRSEGSVPNNGLVLAGDGNLYGGNGTAIYRLNPPPVLYHQPTSNITATSATLNGALIGEGYTGDVTFDYGLTTSYGTSTEPTPFGEGMVPISLSAGVTGLQPFLTYHVRLTAVTALGTFYSQDRAFSTPNEATFNSADDIPVEANGFAATGLPLNLSLGFAPSSGTLLRLVNNTGLSPITGTFNGLPSGSVITATFGAQTYLFVISYTGGDGNDITLTAVTQAITFPSIGTKQTTDAAFTLSATATSGLPVSYTILAGSSSATLAGNTVTLTGTAGPVTIQATQPGDGSTYGPALPAVQTFYVNSGAAFTQISSSKVNSQGFSLAIRAPGTLWGWGTNGNGQLGNGSTSSPQTPVQIGTATNWKSVSVGNQHSVAVRLDGTLWASGYNLYGQLGDGTNTQRTTFTQVGTLTTWAAAVAGYQHTIALKTDGTLWAWGYNSDGELGQGTSDSLTNHTTPVQIGAVTTWNKIVAGSYHTLATRTDGTLWAWGDNLYGQIGNNSTTDVTSPVQVGTATNWANITAGFYSSAAIRSDGTLWTWGRNIEGQIGDGTLTQRNVPTQLGIATNWQTVQAGGYHFLATKTDNTLWSWGWNLYGQLGQGIAETVVRGQIPAQVGTTTGWPVLSGGYDFSVAAKADGALLAWGDNGSNELGYLEKLPLPAAPQFGAIASASAGNGHTAVIKPDGSLWLWGNNGNGQLGIGASDSAPHPVPTQLLPGTTWLSVANGGFHTVALKSDHTLWAWGYNTYGQLGDGSNTQRNSPVQVGNANDWKEVGAGYYTTLAIKQDGTLWACGYNSDGLLALGTTDTGVHSTLVQVGNSNVWNHIYIHGYHALATRADGTLWGWGFNSSGQVGLGTTTTVLAPTQIGTATDWNTISVGLYFSIAIKANGTLWAWGNNGNGQLGDGTFTVRGLPTQIGTATNWRSAAAGYYQTLATKTDGSLWSWGYNFYQQLGNGGTASRNVPTQVGTALGWGDAFPCSYSSLATTADGTLFTFGYANNGSLAQGWRDQTVPDVVLPALSPAQTLTFPAVGNVAIGGSVTFAATASSGLPVNYIVTGPALQNGNQITVTGPGRISIIAYQPGDSYWQSSDIATQIINAPLATVAGVSASNLSATSATIYATINPNGTATTALVQSGISASYGTDTPFVLSNNNGQNDVSTSVTLTGLLPGTTYHYRVAATNLGGTTNSNDFSFTTLSPEIAVFNGATTDPELQDNVGTVDFGTVNIGSNATRLFTIQNTGTSALNIASVTATGDFTANTTSMSNIVAPGATTTFSIVFQPTSSGSLTSTVVINSNDLNEAAFDIPATGNGLQTQTITFGSIAEQACGTPLTLAATASSGLPVSYAITQGNGFASLSGNVVTFTGTGAVTIRATQTGNATYAPATPVDQSFTVVRGVQTLVFAGGIPLSISYTSSAALAASSNKSLVPVTFSVVSGPGSLSGTQLSFTGPGAVSVRAVQSGDACFLPAFADLTITAFNDPPQANNGTASGDEDASSITGTVTATDAQGTALTFAKVSDVQHGTLTLNASTGAFAYTPVLNYNGTDSFTFTASDGIAGSSVATVTLTINAVNDAPVAQLVNVSGNEDASSITGSLAATDVDAGAVLSYVKLSDPAHGSVTVNASTGAFSYVPAANYNGADSFTFKANDGLLDSNVATVQINVAAVNDAPVASDTAASGNEDAASITGQITATDIDPGDSLTYSKVASPSHGTATVNANGSFSYTPAANYNGSDSFTAKANDGNADSNVITVSITVTPVNDAPTVVNGLASGDEDVASITGTLSGSDIDVGDSLTYSKVSNPAHGSVTVAASGSFTYVPESNYNGSDSFTFRANDGTADSNVGTVTISVGMVNDAPVASASGASGDEDTNIVGNLSATDIDGDTLTFVKVSNPAHGSVTISGDTFTYSPTLNYNGDDSFTMKANDGAADSNGVTISITIAPVNDAPTLSNSAASANEDASSVTGTLIGSDVDADALSYAKVTNPAHGQVTVGTTGNWTYTPDQDYNGSDSFTVRANDGALDSNIATVTVSLGAVNDAPLASNGSASGNEDAASITGQLSATDIDLVDTLTYSKVSDPSRGSVTVNSSTGAFSYVPNANANGSDSFTFKVNDGTVDSNIATITITIVPVNDVPVVTSGSAATTEGNLVSGTLIGSDIDTTDTLTYNRVANTSHGIATVYADGTYGYVPTAGYTGVDSFTFKANDGTADSNVATITIVVTSTLPRWGWMGGANTTNAKGLYGTLGSASNSNAPGARHESANWSDGAGSFYMFGGFGHAEVTGPGNLNDLWKYDASAQTWTWLSGSKSTEQGGLAGTQGVASSSNTPGARWGAMSWTDRETGKLWLFGGYGRDTANTYGQLSDLWLFDPSDTTWTFVKGVSTANSNGTYGTVGTPDAANFPSARTGAATWTDAAGNLWLMGGSGRGATLGNVGQLNDLWKYEPTANRWTWVGGANVIGTVGSYAGATPTPGGRMDSVAWMDSSGTAWLFGGYGFATTSSAGYLNDLWKYNASTNRWTFVRGGSTTNIAGNYGITGVKSATSQPGARYGSTAWVDATGQLYLFSGYGLAATGAGYLNDVWSYNPSTNIWTWLNGSNAINGVANYGTLGQTSSSSTPSARRNTTSFADANGDLWVFGGLGNGTNIYFSDLWKLDVPPAPVVQTQDALFDADTLAYTLRASVNPNGLATTARFRYGTEADLSDSTESPAQDLGDGSGAQAITFDLTALAESTTYYYQASADNASGHGIGNVLSFTTPGPAIIPVASFASASASISESGGTATVVVELDHPNAVGFSIPLTVLGSGANPAATGADFTAPASTITFVAGQTAAAITIPIVNDVLDESDEVLTLTLGTPTAGVTLGSITSTTLTLLDNDETPTIITQPQSAFVALNSLTTLSVSATGSEPLSYQWKKNGAIIKGAISSTFIFSASTTAYGSYTVEVTNPSGSQPSDAAEISVVTVANTLWTRAPGATATFTVNAYSASPLLYQWRKASPSGTTPVDVTDSGTRVTGANTKTLNVKLLTTDDSGDYTCFISKADSTGRSSGIYDLSVVTLKPIVLPIGALPPSVVSGFYTSPPIAVDADPLRSPSGFTAKGLPAGLSINSLGIISGRPTAAVVDKAFTVTASNSSGTSLAASGTITIYPLPTSIAGTYVGTIARQPDVADNFGARLDFTTSGTGTCTGKLTLISLAGKVTTTSVTVNLLATIDNSGATPVIGTTGRIYYGRAGLLPLDLNFTLDVPANTISGTLTDPVTGGVAPIQHGYRNIWSKANPADAYEGYYTAATEIPATRVGDQSIPQGNGFISTTVATAGTLSIAGRNPDGTSYTIATIVGPQGQIPMFNAFSANLGSLVGSATITPGSAPDYLTNDLNGNATWSKGIASDKSADRAYRIGFDALPLSIIGGKYTAPGAGQVVMGLPPTTLNNARLVFTEGGLLPNTGSPWTGQSPPVIFSIRNLKTTGTTQTITMPALGGSTNPAKVSFGLLSNPLGQFSGGISIPNPTTSLVRSISYQGTIFRNGTSYHAVGYFLLPKLPTAGQTLSTSPMLSGQVVLEPTAP